LTAPVLSGTATGTYTLGGTLTITSPTFENQPKFPSGSAAAPSIRHIGGETGFYFPAADTVAATTGGTERLRINSSGNVGIGTTSPSSRLHTLTASGENKLIVEAGATSQAATLSLQTNNTTPGQCIVYMGHTSASTNGQVGYDPPTDALYLFTNNTERMRINNSGSVGIGTSLPSYRLHVHNSAATGTTFKDNIILTVSSNGNGADATLNLMDSVNNNAVISQLSGALLFGTGPGTPERMRLDSSGNLIIKRSSAVQPATIVCSATQNTRLMSFVNNNNNNEIGYIFSINDGTTTQYATSSDYRLKENINRITNGLATIGALKPVTYNWISSKSSGEGFIAHELQEHIPLAVTGQKDEVNEEGKPVYQGVDCSKIVVHLVAAIQELKAENDTLKARLDAANL